MRTFVPAGRACYISAMTGKKQDDALGAMAEEIRRRAETPDEEFVEHRPGDLRKIAEEAIRRRAERAQEKD